MSNRDADCDTAAPSPRRTTTTARAGCDADCDTAAPSPRRTTTTARAGCDADCDARWVPPWPQFVLVAPTMNNNIVSFKSQARCRSVSEANDVRREPLCRTL
jgi:hypothetical protein